VPGRVVAGAAGLILPMGVAMPEQDAKRARGIGRRGSLTENGALIGTVAGGLLTGALIAWSCVDLSSKSSLSIGADIIWQISCSAIVVGMLIGAPIGALIGWLGGLLASRHPHARRAA
jgi:hypothetical protein